jgi:DNA-binding PadR family transcriptional regulator
LVLRDGFVGTTDVRLTYGVSRHIVSRHMGKRDPQSLLPLTPAMFYVLVALADGQTHGYAILKDVEQLTGGEVRLSTGTLYGIIKRLLAEGLVREQRLRGQDAARRRSYELTTFGRDVAKAEAMRLEHTLAIAKRKTLFRNVTR